jgi:glutamate mutase epsilon subunit
MAKKLTTEEFIEMSKKVHGDKYKYDRTVYKTAKEKVVITCPIHGDFETVPDKHLRRHRGCPKCANKNTTTEEFIKKAKAIYRDKYDYSKVVYESSKKKCNYYLSNTWTIFLYTKCTFAR